MDVSLLTAGLESETKKDSPKVAAWVSNCSSPKNFLLYSRRHVRSRLELMAGGRVRIAVEGFVTRGRVGDGCDLCKRGGVGLVP